MDKGLIIILDDIAKRLDKLEIRGSRKERIKSEIGFLKDKYSNMEISPKQNEVYDSMVKKGRELTREANIKDIKKIQYYLNYCHAAIYDLKGNLKPLNLIIRGYLISSALFVALSPQYLGAMVPLMLLIPIYLGLKGMKRRSKTGFMYGMSAMPMALLTSVMVLKFEFLDHYSNFSSHILSRAQDINRSPEFTQNLMVAVILLSVALLISSIFTIVTGVKHRKMFV